MKPKKAQLVKLLDNRLILIPLEKIKNGFFDWDNRDKNCEIIKINPPKVNLWVYRKKVGNDIMGNENHIANPATEKEIEKILNENQGICFIQVDYNNELSAPSNGRGYRSILIHLTNLVKNESKKLNKIKS